MMERLTWESYEYTHNDFEDEEAQQFANELSEYENTGLTPDEIKSMQSELSEYKQKLADGRMIELPCKVGDTVFVITQYVINTKEIICCKVETMRVTKRGIVYSAQGKYHNGNYYKGSFAISSVGKTVFLTKEDAEKALRESEQNEI